MEKISDDLNEMKCPLFCGISITVKEAEIRTTSGGQLGDKIQKWLSPTDPSINHKTASEVHHNGTAAWFLDKAVYNEWKAREARFCGPMGHV